jgi:hypothetical protein
VKKHTIKRDIYELKRTTQNIKEELITDLENLRRKNQTEILEINPQIYKNLQTNKKTGNALCSPGFQSNMVRTGSLFISWNSPNTVGRVARVTPLLMSPTLQI